MVQEELRKLKWEEAELGERRKGDPKKIRMALRVRRETTMTHAWIAERLHMGAKSHLNICFTGINETSSSNGLVNTKNRPLSARSCNGKWVRAAQ